ncbi:hypothetical protein GCM10007981_16150 [Thermocladium modestius]|uniref:HTH marR-type domain-containing protein n=1 Tax=Thermocladium modestius TaxID=62609 RepID=A0A830GYX4_9CREN|nr:helix-turn-helix domain-containing protein [Thermocladium modestius]GGP21981.1 hypothetical protein GCM10007981_16150 [Thermocladium modestius]
MTIRVLEGVVGGNHLPVQTIALLPKSAFDELIEAPLKYELMGILANGPATVTEASAKLRLLKGAVHRHIKSLEELGWIRQLSAAEAKRLNLTREANRIYYIPTALVYLGYSIEYDNDNTVIKMLSNYGAFIDSRKGKFILRTPTARMPLCESECPEHQYCSDWAMRTAKQFKVNVVPDRMESADSIILRILYSIAMRELKSNMDRNPLFIFSTRFDNVYREKMGSPV